MQRYTCLISRAMFLSTLLCAAALPVAARPSLSSSIAGYADTSDLNRININTPAASDTSLVSQIVTQSSINSLANSRGEARSQTDFGINKVFAKSEAVGDFDLFVAADAEAIATSVWEDTVTVNLAGQTGQSGTIRYAFNVSGTRFESPLFTETNRFFQVRKDGVVVAQLSNPEADGIVTSDITNIIYGTPFTISASLRVQTNALAPDELTEATLDYFNTATVTAITTSGDGVTFDSNNAYSTAVITNTGGVVVVPEAGSLALVLPTLGVLAVALTRRRFTNG
ncbi:MAG: hypothetical protein H7145_07560 [Akkermansiaceae bacterium]|nr:hypothetical protein [Armatimonadota bacterium]